MAHVTPRDLARADQTAALLRDLTAGWQRMRDHPAGPAAFAARLVDLDHLTLARLLARAVHDRVRHQEEAHR